MKRYKEIFCLKSVKIKKEMSIIVNGKDGWSIYIEVCIKNFTINTGIEGLPPDFF